MYVDTYTPEPNSCRRLILLNVNDLVVRASGCLLPIIHRSVRNCDNWRFSTTTSKTQLNLLFDTTKYPGLSCCLVTVNRGQIPCPLSLLGDKSDSLVFVVGEANPILFRLKTFDVMWCVLSHSDFALSLSLDFLHEFPLIAQTLF